MTTILLLALMIFTTALPVSAIPAYKKGANSASPSYASGKYYRHVMSIPLTGDGVADVLAVALSQLGYSESASNNLLSGETNGRGNHTEYNRNMGDIEGDGYEMEWCAAFCSWALLQGGATTHNSFNAACRKHPNDPNYIWREVGCPDPSATPSEHDYKLVSTNDVHYYACECGISLTSSAPHQYVLKTSGKSTHSFECETCKKVKTEAHVFNQNNNTECICGAKTISATTPEPPTTDEENNEIITPPQGQEHVHDCAIEFNDTQHWDVCDCGYVGEKEDHSIENGSCTECGYVQKKQESTPTDIPSDTSSDTTNSETTKEKSKKPGCKASVGGFAILGTTLIIGTGFAVKRKEN